LFVFGGCAPKKQIEPPKVPEPAPISAESADSAWEDEDFRRSAELYKKLLQDTDPEGETRSLYYYRLAASLKNLDRCSEAERALEAWSQRDPLARTKWRWHEVRTECLLKAQDKEAWKDHLTEVILGSRYPYPLKKKAADLLIRHFWKQKDYAAALPILSELFDRTEEKDRRVELQNMALNRFNGLSDQALSRLEESERKTQKPPGFPYNLLAWSYWLREAEQNPESWEEIWPHLHSVAYGDDLPDPDPLREKLRELEEELGEIGRRICLTIPLSGSYSKVGWKVLRGASLAQWELAKKGKKIRVTTVNTGEKGWRDKIDDLPGTRIFGGPLTGENWERIKESGLHRNRVFFTFLSSLKNEGRDGWRFFPSPRDQVRRLLQPSVDRLNIRRYAILYPEDDYGRDMARIFWKEATENGAKITGMQSYPPDKPTEWGKAVQTLLQVEDPEDPTQTPDPDFQAVFIPDSFSRVEGIVPQFFYYDEERLLFLGPMLWSQSSAASNLENNYFGLALTNGPWLPDSPSGSRRDLAEALELTMQGEPDFWTALGYDFVRHCSRMPDIDSGREDINRSLAELPAMQWTMAPITWDRDGLATQNLYVLRFSGTGLVPAHYPSVEALILHRKDKHSKRMEKLEKELEEEKEAGEDNPGELQP
ncbi:MAG: penicillin-binding protein activator, partial [Desulfonatronovibrionaceae bacterium]